MTKKPNIPDGYTKHDGDKMPVGPNVFVDCIILTGEGLGHSGPHRAKYTDWANSHHPAGIGSVVAYKEMPLGDGHTIDLRKRWD